ncbi:hypothetical protein ACTHQ2_22985 [Bacillus subtilis]|uniref:hypothetical protein n=1 Tax=Bacillus subtilis TaxID=1423 RepID=UPI003F7BF0DF
MSAANVQKTCESTREKLKPAIDRIEQFLVQQSLLFHLTEKPVETAYLPSVRGLSFNSQGWVNLRHIWFP